MLAEIYVCCEAQLKAYAKRCVKANYSFMLSASTTKMLVASTHVSKGKGTIQLNLRRVSPSSPIIVKRVCRAKRSYISSNLMIGAKGRLRVRSMISSSSNPTEVSMVYKPATSRLLKVIYSTKNIKILMSNWGSFIPEISMPVFNRCTVDNFTRQKKIDIEVLKEYNTSDEFKGDRRNWLVARVNFSNCPVMFILNTGWQGITHPSKYIIDLNRYHLMISYLFNMIEADPGGEHSTTYDGNNMSFDGTILDRPRTIHYEKVRGEMPQALKELIHELGDYNPTQRDKIYGHEIWS